MQIELAGASGIGKTTALSLITDNLLGQHDVALGDALVDALKKAHSERAEVEIRQEIDKTSMFESPDFIQQYLILVSGLQASQTQKIKLIQLMGKQLHNHHVRRSLSFRNLVVDEGFVHFDFHLSQFSADLESAVCFFYNNIPLPRTVIQLHAMPEVVLSRIQQRKTSVNSYLYRTDGELLYHLSRVDWYLSIMESALRKRGCRVRHIDANGPAEQWAQVLEDVIDEEIFLHEKGLNTLEPLC